MKLPEIKWKDPLESDFNIEITIEEDNGNASIQRLNRRYNLRQNPARVQSLGNHDPDFLRLIKSIY